MVKYPLKLKFHYNFIFLFILISNIKGKEILNQIEDYKTNSFNNEPKGVFTEYLNNLKELELIIPDNFTSNLLIYFTPINCQINVTAQIKLEKTTKRKFKEKNESIFINNNNASSVSFKNIYNNYNNITKFTIKLLKNIRENKNCPLIINSFEIDNPETPKLTIKENEPTFLYFNDSLKKVDLLYNFENTIKSPIIVSFFIKEKIKFNIKILEDGNNIIINRNISYKENIFIYPKSLNIIKYTISISSDKNIYNTTMIVKIIKDNSTPFYLQKNQLYLGFIPIELDHYYYYMEVFKGEEGEITLFNKRQNGILISRIIEKENNITPGIDKFPKYNENNAPSNNYLEFNIYNQKLSYYSSNTEKCEEGCFLLITYYSNISEPLGISGTEFSLLSINYDEDIFKAQIINIPLNEYIWLF